MITYVSGNLFESPAKVLVNTVNTEGVMGKGIALEFKRIYPEMFEEYRALCERRKLTIGALHLFKTPHKWILNFPTKKTWRQPSRVEYIQAGLQTLVRIVAEADITSLAMPPLGCGNGQLDYESQVKPLVEQYLGKLSVPVFVYRGRAASGLVEQSVPEEISKWLRSQPESLPFDEVWEDVLALLDKRSVYHTATSHNEYTVHPVEDPPSLAIEAANKSYKIDREQLLEFWQQLRDFGFSYRSIAPEHHRISYLIPIFEQLPYVRRVSVSDSSNLKRNVVALQVRPPARSEKPSVPGDLFAPRLNAK
jgi:O-acetyl-ADP-ribose deacetylase (regulator of RNase III)